MENKKSENIAKTVDPANNKGCLYFVLVWGAIFLLLILAKLFLL